MVIGQIIAGYLWEKKFKDNRFAAGILPILIPIAYYWFLIDGMIINYS